MVTAGGPLLLFVSKTPHAHTGCEQNRVHRGGRRGRLQRLGRRRSAMSVRKLTVTSMIAGGLCLGVVGAAPASAVCDTYSGGCPSSPPSSKPIGGGNGGPGS